MHELGVALAIRSAAMAELEKHAPARLREVRVRVGELAGVEPQLLALAWDSLVSEGPHAGCTLVVERELARQSCPTCGEVVELQVGSWLRLCPNCDLPLRIEGGDALDLIQIGFDQLEEQPT